MDMDLWHDFALLCAVRSSHNKNGSMNSENQWMRGAMQKRLTVFSGLTQSGEVSFACKGQVLCRQIAILSRKVLIASLLVVIVSSWIQNLFNLSVAQQYPKRYRSISVNDFSCWPSLIIGSWTKTNSHLTKLFENLFWANSTLSFWYQSSHISCRFFTTPDNSSFSIDYLKLLILGSRSHPRRCFPSFRWLEVED